MPQQPLARVGDLEIEQQLEVQEASWRLQRIGWVGMVLLLVVALAGGFGRGPWSRARVGAPGGLEVDYGRFERRTQEARLVVRLGPQPAGLVRLWIDGDYLARQPLQNMLPQPERMALSSGRLILDLRVSGDRPEIRIDTRPERFGRQRGRLGLLDGPEVAFEQFVYP
jgi:hypothetical protein